MMNLKANDINIIFILSSIGIAISFFNSVGAKMAGYLIIILSQSIWLVLLSSSVGISHSMVVFVNILITFVQIISLYYLFNTLNLHDDKLLKYPEEYISYINISHAMISVMLLLQYFVAVPLIKNNEDGHVSSKFAIAIINTILLGITVSRIRIFNQFFLITDG